VATTWGHWSIKLSGKAAGRQIIRINTLLQSTPAAVPDEPIQYVIYHELLHHLLPAQGHDAEFRMLEARWPNAVELDLWFDTIHERWDTRPESYNGDT
jgi:predicted metal-dependent hydrolase